MKNSQLSPLDSLPYFTIEAVKQLVGDEYTSPGSIHTALYRWMKAGIIVRLKKGIYMTRRFFVTHRADIDFAAMVSAILIPQSYISVEYILQSSGILTDITYPITAITIKQTRVIINELGNFTYRNIKPDLFTGFYISEYSGVPIARASLAKALFDLFYLRPWKNRTPSENYDLSEELRLNLDEFSEKDRIEFGEYVGMSKSRKMVQILHNLEKSVWRH